MAVVAQTAPAQARVRRAPTALAVLLVALGLLGFLAPRAGAADGPTGEPTSAPERQRENRHQGNESSDESTLTWSARPTPTEDQPERPNFSGDLEPGAVVEDSIRVRNFQSGPLPLRIYASDALTTASGALDLLPAGEEPTDVGAWITLEESTIEVPGQGYVDVPFTMVVPDDAEPGDHVGGIVTSYATDTADDDGQPVVVDRRLGNRVQVRVDGPLRPELTVTELDATYTTSWNPFSSGSLHVTYTVTNTGNVRLGAGQVAGTEGPFGWLGREQAMDPIPELLPGNSLNFTVDVSGVWPTFGTTTSLRLDLVPTRASDEFDVPPVATSVSTATIPWVQLILLALLAGSVFAQQWGRRRRRRREDARVKEAVAAALATRDTGDATPSDESVSGGAR